MKWSGYSSDTNSWEIEQNIDCPDLIQEYHEMRKKKQKKAPASRKSVINTTKKRVKSKHVIFGSVEVERKSSALELAETIASESATIVGKFD